MGERKVRFEDQDIVYEFEKKNVKNINMRIRRDGSVHLSAHPLFTGKQADEFMLRHARFVLEARERMQQLAGQAPKEAQYENGEAFYYLGKRLTVQLVRARDHHAAADNRHLYLFLKEPQSIAARKKLADQWIRQQCMELFRPAMAQIGAIFASFGVTAPTLRVRNMKSRWGSCIPSRKIVTLNLQLIHADPSCTLYVICHEFCHFIHPNHSKQFHALMTRLMPDWKERKKLLNNSAEHWLVR